MAEPEKKIKVKDFVVDWALSEQAAKAAAENREFTEIVNGVKISFKNSIQELQDPKTSRDAMLALEDKIRRLREEKKKVWYTTWIFDLVEVFMTLMKDFFLMSNYAQIVGEVTRLRPLRKDFRPTALQPPEVLEFRQRTPEYQAEAKKVLQEAGYTDTDIERLVRLKEQIPSGQDVITYMVREVYDEDLRKRFEMDKGFDRLYGAAKEDADRAAIPKETLAKYWAAHWRLPGIVQGFEMLHRGQIDIEALRRLLTASDIMPGFIEPLINISYNPYTRVDVRRMHKLGVLNDDELLKAYTDLGYSKDFAANMVKFTLAYNKEPDDQDMNEFQRRKLTERDLTKSDIISMYNLRILTESRASDLLQSIGYDEIEAELYLERADTKEELDRVDDLVSAYRKEFLAGISTESEARGKMQKLGLPSAYVQSRLDIWTIEADVKMKQPSKAELMSFLKKGVISKTVAERELQNIGYDRKYVTWFIKAAETE